MAKVDFVNNDHDLQALVYGSLGLSTEFIADRTRLTPSQVLYRLKLQQVRRADYRNGGSPVAGLMLKVMTDQAASVVRRSLPASNGGRRRRRR